MPTSRFRMPRTGLLPVVVLLLCVLPFSSGAPWALVVLLVPLAVAAWIIRSGVDVGDAGITARSLLGERTVAWDDVAGLRVGPRSELFLVTTRSTEIRLPVLRARDLPALSRVSGGRIDVPAPPDPPA